ncbi:MAG: hypothetical protein ACT4OO_13280 [Nitrospiraceae bacterium]
MQSKHLSILLAVFAGFLGGILSGTVVRTEAVDAGLAPPQRHKILTAEQFVLVDANGVPRGRLGGMPDGSVKLTLNDRQLKDRITMGLSPDGSPSLGLFDENERTRTLLAINKWVPIFTLTDKQEVNRTTLAVVDDGTPRLRFMDGKGKVVHDFPIELETTPEPVPEPAK